MSASDDCWFLSRSQLQTSQGGEAQQRRGKEISADGDGGEYEGGRIDIGLKARAENWGEVQNKQSEEEMEEGGERG